METHWGNIVCSKFSVRLYFISISSLGSGARREEPEAGSQEPGSLQLRHARKMLIKCVRQLQPRCYWKTLKGACLKRWRHQGPLGRWHHSGVSCATLQGCTCIPAPTPAFFFFLAVGLNWLATGVSVGLLHANDALVLLIFFLFLLLWPLEGEDVIPWACCIVCWTDIYYSCGWDVQKAHGDL